MSLFKRIVYSLLTIFASHAAFAFDMPGGSSGGGTLINDDGTYVAFTSSINFGGGILVSTVPSGAIISVNVSTMLARGSTDYIQNSSTLQQGATAFISSGTISSLTVSTITFPDGTTMETAATGSGGLSSVSIYSQGSFVGNASSINVTQDLLATVTGGTATFSVSLSTLNTRVTNLESGGTVLIDGTTRFASTYLQNTMRSTGTWSSTQAFTNDISVTRLIWPNGTIQVSSPIDTQGSSGGGSGDSFGSHLATQVVNMDGFGIMNSSQISIGANSPNFLLAVSTTAGYGSGLFSISTGTTELFSVYPSSIIAGAGTEVYISSGRVGINTSTPTTQLHVGNGFDAPAALRQFVVNNNGNAGMMVLDSANNVYYDVIVGAASSTSIGNASNHAMNLKTNGSTRVGISAAGNVAIGVNSPTAGFDVNNGSMTIRSSASALQVSTITVGGYNLFYSSASPKQLGGFVIAFGSGTLTAGESQNIDLSAFTSIAFPIVSEIAADAEANQINIESDGPSSFVVKNKSALNTKRFNWWAFMQP